jgi:hypothetical protein
MGGKVNNNDNYSVNFQGGQFRAADVSASNYTTEFKRPFQINVSESGDLMILGSGDQKDETKKILVHLVEGWNPVNAWKVFNDASNTITSFVAIY